MDANEYARIIRDKGYNIRVNMYRSGVVDVAGDIPGGKVSVTLNALKTSPPSGQYRFTDEENSEIDSVLSAVVFNLGQIIEKANMRIIGDVGISGR